MVAAAKVQAARDRMRREEDTEPSVSFGAKELFMEINRKLDVLTDTFHTKADRTELVRLTDEVREIQRHGSDTAKQTEKDTRELSTRTERLERETATSVAVEQNRQQLEQVYRTSRFQWIGIGVTVLLFLISIGMRIAGK